jgi:DNA-binding NtrC family response regulator
VTGEAVGPRILIVEDDAEMRRLLAEFLRAEGFQVTVAADAAEALRCAHEAVFASVVLDKNLPGVSGLDLLPRLRKLSPGAPVIMITAFGNPGTHEEAFSRGAYELLFKPFNLDDLLDVLLRAQECRDVGPSKDRRIIPETPLAGGA